MNIDKIYLCRHNLINGGLSNDLFLIYNGCSYADIRSVLTDNPILAIPRLQSLRDELLKRYKNLLHQSGVAYVLYLKDGKKRFIYHSEERKNIYQNLVIIALALKLINSRNMIIKYE